MGEKKNISGQNIRRERLEKGWTQAELAMHMVVEQGVFMSSCMVSDIECGRRCVWDRELFGFSKVLGVSVSKLLSWR